MERKIGEVFEFEGKKCVVVEDNSLYFNYSCLNCVFAKKPISYCEKTARCLPENRQDGKSFIFVEVKE